MATVSQGTKEKLTKAQKEEIRERLKGESIIFSDNESQTMVTWSGSVLSQEYARRTLRAIMVEVLGVALVGFIWL